MGLYLGFLLFEVLRRDWKNVTLIGTVGVLNGIGWSLLQNWSWASKFWPDAQHNFWRSWETSGGISIGIAYGVAYYLLNRRPTSDASAATCAARARAISFRLAAAFYHIRPGLRGDVACGHASVVWPAVEPGRIWLVEIGRLWLAVGVGRHRFRDRPLRSMPEGVAAGQGAAGFRVAGVQCEPGALGCLRRTHSGARFVNQERVERLGERLSGT